MKYLNMIRLVIKSLIEWDEVYLTDAGRVITGAEWDVLCAMDQARFATADEGDQIIVGSCWVARLHLEVDDE